MDKTWGKRWVKALRSGKYKQGTRRLRKPFKDIADYIEKKVLR